MGGFCGVVSKEDAVSDLFFGTDYHSHLGTHRGGMAVLGANGFQRSIHNIQNSPFRSKFEHDVTRFSGNVGIGVISDTDPQPLVMYSNMAITERIKLSATWVYSSGNYVTIPLAIYTAVRHDGHSTSPKLYDYGAPNTMRMAAYHRLDVGVQFIRKKRNTIRTWDVGLYNAYCRANPYYYYVGTDSNDNLTLRQVAMFPIMPSVSWSIKF